jgi:hypothetical protein
MPNMVTGDSDGDDDRSGVDLTSFLFGNIDESGNLEDDGLLDNESKRMLPSLCRMGLGSLLAEVIEPGDEPQDDINDKGIFIYFFKFNSNTSFRIKISVKRVHRPLIISISANWPMICRPRCDRCFIDVETKLISLSLFLA